MGISASNGISINTADDRYVNIVGDIMEGNLTFPTGTQLHFGTNDSYLQINGNVVELYVNGLLAQTWEKDPLSTPVTGNPIGLLMGLTYT